MATKTLTLDPLYPDGSPAVGTRLSVSVDRDVAIKGAGVVAKKGAVRSVTVGRDGVFPTIDVTPNDDASLQDWSKGYALIIEAEPTPLGGITGGPWTVVVTSNDPATLNLSDLDAHNVVGLPPNISLADTMTRLTAVEGTASDAAATANDAKTSAQSAATSAADSLASVQGIQADVAQSAADAAASAALVGAPAGDAIDAHLGGDSTGLVPSVNQRVILPLPAEQTIFVTPRGNDANDGRSLHSAKATIGAALTALAGNPGIIQLGVGTFNIAATLTIPSGTIIRGSGRQLGATIINYTGTGTLFQGTSGTRTYNIEISNLGLVGPGKTTGTTAIDLVDVSQAKVADISIQTFGTGIYHRSTIAGGAVYNRFRDSLLNSCTTGALFGPTGSNGSSWLGVKFGANTTAVSITDSNQNNFTACQFEANGTGVFLDCSLAGLNDHSSFAFCRFESNTVPWNINSANVRDTEISWPAIFGTWNAPIDKGTRTKVLTSYPQLPPPGAIRSVLTRAGSYALAPGDDVVFFNASGSAITATLPDPATVTIGRQYVLRQRGTVALTVAAAAGTVDVTSIPAGGHAVYVTDGTNWYSIG